MAAYAPSAGGRSGPGVSQGEGEHNLFREAEKKYQLHWDQRMRSRRGRVVGGKLVERPTDLSGLVDVHAGPEAVQAWLQSGVLQEHSVSLDLRGIDGLHSEVQKASGVLKDSEVLKDSRLASGQGVADGLGCSNSSCSGCGDGGSCSGCGDGGSGGGSGSGSSSGSGRDGEGTPCHCHPSATQRCFSLPSHPGFLLLPGALPPSLQLRLMADSLALYPEPPANTNHTLRYGHLPGLWEAARKVPELSLVFRLGIDGPLGQGPAAAATGATGATGATAAAEATVAARATTAADATGATGAPGSTAEAGTVGGSGATFVAASAPHTARQTAPATSVAAAAAAMEGQPGTSPHATTCPASSAPPSSSASAYCATALLCTPSSASPCAPSSSSPCHCSLTSRTRPICSSCSSAPCSSSATPSSSAPASSSSSTTSSFPSSSSAPASSASTTSSFPSSSSAPTTSSAPASSSAPCSSSAPSPSFDPCFSASPSSSSALTISSAPSSSSAPCSSSAPSSSSSSSTAPWPWVVKGPGPSAHTMLRKLRWATLGPQFNWTARTYEADQAHRPLPPELREVGVRVAAAVQHLWTPLSQQQQQQPQQPQQLLQPQQGQPPLPQRQQQRQQHPFAPDAAIINYYHPGDTLGGHLDDVEPDMDAPIVGLSLGCDAVFLMGGERRDEAPVALRLRSGDVVVLAGRARRCYHGVPRVFGDQPLPQELMQAAAHAKGCEAANQHFAAQGEALAGMEGYTAPTPAVSAEEQGVIVGAAECRATGLPAMAEKDLEAVLQHTQRCRVSISIRAVAPAPPE